jgi:hypothetical protein
MAGTYLTGHRFLNREELCMACGGVMHRNHIGNANIRLVCVHLECLCSTTESRCVCVRVCMCVCVCVCVLHVYVGVATCAGMHECMCGPINAVLGVLIRESCPGFRGEETLNQDVLLFSGGVHL